jgi:HEAT repeat protein
MMKTWLMYSLAACVLGIPAAPARAYPTPLLPKEQIPPDMPPAVRKHVEALYDDDDATCRTAAVALGRMGPAAASAAPFLASVLHRHRTCPTPNRARDALIAIGKAAVVPTLIALRSEDWNARVRAMVVMLALKDPRAIPDVAHLVADGATGPKDANTFFKTVMNEAVAYFAAGIRAESAQTRRVAAAALPALYNQDAVDMLLEAVGDSDDTVRQHAMEGLINLRNGTYGRALAFDLPATESMYAALKAPSASTRRLAIRILYSAMGTADPQALIKVCSERLHDDDRSVRLAAMDALGNVGQATNQAEVVRALLQVRDDNDPLIRASLVNTLGTIRHPAAIEAVGTFMDDESSAVRQQAVRSSALTMGTNMIPRFVTIINEGKDPMIRRAAIRELARWRRLGDLGDPGRFLDDPDETIRLAVVDAASVADPTSRKVLLRALSNSNQKVAILAATRLTADKGYVPAREDLPLILQACVRAHYKVRVPLLAMLAGTGVKLPDLAPIRRTLARGAHGLASAITILRQHNDRSQHKAIARLVTSGTADTAKAAVQTMGAWGDYPAMIPGFSHRDHKTQRFTGHALVSLHDPAATAFLREALGRDDRTARHIAHALGHSATERHATDILAAAFRHVPNAWAGRIPDLLLRRRDEAVPAVARLLEDDAPNVRAGAADLLLRLKRADAIPALAKRVDDDNASVRMAVVRALAELGTPEAVAPLLRGLSDANTAIRAQAVSGLGAAGDARAIQPLAALTADTCWRTRSLAAESLGMIDDQRTVAALRRLVRDPHWRVRRIAVDALAQRGGDDTVPLLIASLDDPHWHVRKGAGSALQQLTGETLPATAADWRNWWNTRTRNTDNGPTP